MNFTESEILASIPKAQRVLNRLNKVLGWSYLFQWIRNKAKSEDFTMLTPTQEESFIDIILKNFESSFGWVKKMKM